MITKIWHRLFLEERPSIGLAFFRIFAAITTGFHVIPSLCHLEDNYYQTAFKSLNLQFFTPGAVQLVQKSPDGLVLFFVFFFLLTWFFFLIGLYTQVSCLLMVVACYYFYALNCFHIGTLSWDILLVTLFLLCLTPYPGDYFAVDSLRRGDVLAYQKRRPFFIQRLLAMQIASTFFYTAFYKITAEGNWLKDNPIYYLMNYPPAGVTKFFLVKDFLANKPDLCYWIGVAIVVCELLLPLFLFIPKTRRSAIILGIFFHVLLILTLDVPAIFFFLFPAQLLLFINPGQIEIFIKQKRKNSALGVQSILVYDGRCRFCLANVNYIRIMDLFSAVKMIDYNSCQDLSTVHPDLTKSKAASQLHLIEPDGSLYGGYFVLRRLSWKMPMLYPLIPILYFPFSGSFGSWAYRLVAQNRYLFHFNKTCRDNQCLISPHPSKIQPDRGHRRDGF